jgi:RNA-binding protein YhbY
MSIAMQLAASVARQNVSARGQTLTIDRSGGVNRHLPIAR